MTLYGTLNTAFCSGVCIAAEAGSLACLLQAELVSLVQQQQPLIRQLQFGLQAPRQRHVSATSARREPKCRCRTGCRTGPTPQ